MTRHGRTAGMAAIAILVATAAFAGRAHFVGLPQLSVSGNSLTISGKVAGLGDVPQIEATLTATAECINPGNNNPKAANKEAVTAFGVFPTQNGKALFILSAEASFQPDCSPPMTVEFSNISLLITAADGTSLSFP
jgi:hypothetical protein